MDNYINISVDDIINEQPEANRSDRYNDDKIKTDYIYCANIAKLLLDQVLNKSYYPLLTDEDIKYIINLNIMSVCLNLLYPYFLDASFIRKYQKMLNKTVEEYEAEHMILYLRDSNSLYNHMFNYLNETFYNLV